MTNLKLSTNEVGALKIPKTVGVIMDGNRRYAKANNLPVALGHKAGFEKLKEVVKWSKDCGVERIIAYALSTENWKRSEEEVHHLLNLFRYAVSKADSILKKGVRKIKFIGNLKMFPKDLHESMRKVERMDGKENGIELILAVSYGGRDEVVEAVRKIIKNPSDEINEKMFAGYLFTKGMPDPDMILRTGGEMRLSNFLLWQSAYSELFFTKTLWPAFTKNEFVAILDEYGRRKRNFGA